MSDKPWSKYSLRRLRKRLRIPPPRKSLQEHVMGMRIEYDPQTAIGQQLYYRGAFERAEIEFCSQILSGFRSPSVIDVGANIGMHSLYWAIHNESLTCRVFEPSRTTGQILRKNIAMNRVEDRITIYQQALSDVAGEATFYECSDGAFSSLKNTNRKPVVAETRVPVSTLDAWASAHRITKVDLIKIDVEGLEHEVVCGAREVMCSLKPHLFIEIFGGEQSNKHPESTIELVSSFGYDVFVFHRDRGLQPYSGHSDQNYNYYFSPTRARETRTTVIA